MRLNFVFGIALIAVISFALCSCDINYFEKNEIKKKGEVVIAKIEAFKKEKGRLPEDLAEIGVAVSEGGPIFYQKKNSSSYEVWDTIGFDRSYVYDSETQKWK